MRRALRCLLPGLIAAAIGAAGGCGTTDIPVLLAAAGGTPGAEAGVDVQAPPVGPEASAPGTKQDYCAGSGPPVLVETSADGGSVSACPDALAQRAFRYALCACGNYVSDHALITDAFDGAQGPYEAATATAGGSVGVNGDLHPGPMNIRGALWASNSTDVTTSTAMEVGELHALGELHPASLIVQADAWMLGGIQTSGNVTVQGTLHIPGTAPKSVAGTFTTGAIDTTTPFTVLPACDCGSSPFVDVAGVVRTYESPTENDDAALGISPTMLENVQSDLTKTLPCGRIFLTSIGGNASIHLTVQGRVALFVRGDLSTSDFEIDVPTGSELDLFVGGDVNVRGLFLVGSASNPARARTYVGGTTVNLQSAATLAGNLYAPGATITLGGTAPTTLYGALFTSSLSSGSDLTIHYDKAILSPSSTPSCAAPTACQSCNDCNGQACNSGTCGYPCADSTQCCAPLVCSSQGTCVADVIPR
jgi:hypothetical protein